MIAAHVYYAKYNDLVIFQSIEQLVGETPRQHSTKPTIVNRVALRIADQNVKRSLNFSDELRTKACSLILVPVSGFAQISLGARPNDEAPFHASITG